MKSMNNFDYRTSIIKGQEYNKYVAGLLQSFGVPEVTVPPFLDWANNPMEQLEITKNEKDLLVDDLVIEVKSRNVKFQDMDDFRYATVMVDTVYGWQQKTIKPFAYIIVSQITGGLFVIPGSSQPDWTIEEYYDPARDITDKFYLTTKKHCRPFLELVDVLLERADERTNQMQ